MEGEAEAEEKSENKKKGMCPASICGDLPLDRKEQVVTGGIIILLSLMTLTSFGLIWLLFVFGGALIYGGMTGNCLFRKTVAKLCDKDKEGGGEPE